MAKRKLGIATSSGKKFKSYHIHLPLQYSKNSRLNFATAWKINKRQFHLL